MNTPRLIFLLMAGAGLLFPGCKTEQNKKPDLVLTGSETELPLVSSFAAEFQAGNALNISLSGGGSNTGIRDLIEGRIDIANSSRIVTDYETEVLRSKKVKWIQAIIGSDAIAIITNRTFQIESLSLEQISAVFSGKATNWKEVGGPDRPIHPFGRNSRSGTHDYMKHRLNIDNYKPNMSEYETYAEILNAVKNDSNAIAYVSASCLPKNVPVREQPVHVVNVFMDGENGISPFNEEAISSGEYIFVRPLLQYYDSANTNPWIKKFIEFEISPKGESMLKQNGYYPINVFHRQINSFKGLK